MSGGHDRVQGVKPNRLLPLFAAALVPALFLAGPGQAEEREREGRDPVRLIATVPVPPVPGNASGGLYVFDISFIDPHTQLDYLADRSNAVIDVIDARTNVFVKQIKGGFKGFTGSNDTSGPNGVVTAGRFLFVSDANSRVVSIDLGTDKVISEVSTGGAPGLRADEVAYDPADGLLLAVNNADDPPFATVIKVNKTTGVLTRGARVTFTDATNGAEQPIWDPRTQRFYISIPEVNGPGGTGPNGAVYRITPDPVNATVDKVFPVQLCQPAGLTHGPGDDVLIGCSVVFDTKGQAWSNTDPNSAAPQQVILNVRTGAVDSVPGVGGSDEVWFNPGDDRYYTASRNNPTGPVLGVIDAEDETLVQVVPTFNVAKTATHPSGTAHSVAADLHNNHVFVPLPANNAFPDCLKGCVAVFGAPEGKEQTER